jgi:hypothetical protein
LEGKPLKDWPIVTSKKPSAAVIAHRAVLEREYCPVAKVTTGKLDSETVWPSRFESTHAWIADLFEGFHFGLIIQPCFSLSNEYFSDTVAH